MQAGMPTVRITPLCLLWKKQNDGATRCQKSKNKTSNRSRMWQTERPFI